MTPVQYLRAHCCRARPLAYLDILKGRDIATPLVDSATPPGVAISQ